MERRSGRRRGWFKESPPSEVVPLRLRKRDGFGKSGGNARTRKTNGTDGRVYKTQKKEEDGKEIEIRGWQESRKTSKEKKGKKSDRLRCDGGEEQASKRERRSSGNERKRQQGRITVKLADAELSVM